MAKNAYTWITTNHRMWNKKREVFGSLDEFSDYLGVKIEDLQVWISRKGKPSVEESLRMCKATWDFSLMENLGYLDNIHLKDMEDKSVGYVLRLRTATLEGKRIIDAMNLDVPGKEEEKEKELTKVFASYNFRKTGKKSA